MNGKGRLACYKFNIAEKKILRHCHIFYLKGNSANAPVYLPAVLREADPAFTGEDPGP